MATLRDIRRRITSVTGTQQITNAMKMVSAAKLNRAQQAAVAAQPYSRKLRRMVSTLSQGLTADDHPLIGSAPGGKDVVILFTSDRGLCGGFNSNLIKFLVREFRREAIREDTELIVVGRVGNDYFKKRPYAIDAALVQMPLSQKQTRIREVLEVVVQRVIDGEVSKVLLVYNTFRNPLRQDPIMELLLPVVPPGSSEDEGEAIDERESLFEPSRREILDSLLARYIENQCVVALLNTEAGEHGSRMVAMESATKNAGEMIARLTLQYNRARQAQITQELTEIVNGAEAL